MYNRWPSEIGQAEVCLVQLPGRENRIREPHFGTYENLAAQFVDAVLPELDRPFGFFGHCGGALPGFAVAVELTRRGLPGPSALFISSQVPPHLVPQGGFFDMSNAELVAELAKLTRELGGQPQPDLIAMELRVLRADLEAGRKYHLSHPIKIGAAINVVIWKGDGLVSREQMAEWCRYCENEQYNEICLKGEHYSFLDAPSHLLHELDEGMLGGNRPKQSRAPRDTQ